MSTVSSGPILIGDLLVRSELCTPRDMADALPISLKTGLPVGRVLIGSGALTEESFQQALMAQSLIRDSLLSIDLAVQALRIVAREHFSLDQALKIVGWQPESFREENRLGKLLLSAGVINEEHLNQALRIFYNTGLPLARVLVLKGHITNIVAYAALSSQQLVRDEKLSRQQAVQAVRAARASNAKIDDDYVNTYLHLVPGSTLRFGELLVLAKLVSEEALVNSVETALARGESLADVLVSTGLVHADTLERALEAQLLVTKGTLDVSKAGDLLRKADYERITVAKAIKKSAPAVLLSVSQTDLEPVSQAPNFFDEAIDSDPATLSRQHKSRSHEETRARQLASRLLDKLEALTTRNKYMRNVLDHTGPDSAQPDLLSLKRELESINDFDATIDAVERLMARLETASYQNGFLRSRADFESKERDLQRKLQASEEMVKLLKVGQSAPSSPVTLSLPSAEVRSMHAAATIRTESESLAVTQDLAPFAESAEGTTRAIVGTGFTRPEADKAAAQAQASEKPKEKRKPAGERKSSKGKSRKS